MTPSPLFSLHQSSLYFLHIEDGEEGTGVYAVNYLFQLGHFQAGHHAVEHILVVLQEAPLAVETGDGAVVTMKMPLDESRPVDTASIMREQMK